jgi:hypothetical protein
MFMPLFFQKSINLIIAIVLIIGGVITFQNEITFDWLFFGILFFIGLICQKNVNLLGVVLIFVCAKLVEELGWIIFSDNVLTRIIVYLSLMITLKIIKEETYKIPIAILLFLSVIIEFYWMIVDYAAPEIYWYIFEINIAVLVRHYLFMRVFFTRRLFPGRSNLLRLDFDIQDIAAVLILVHATVVVEYFLRHILTIDISAAWYYKRYIFHILQVYIIYLILTTSAELALEGKLKA